MKEIVEYLQKKNLIFKSLKEISPKELGSRKKIKLYLGVDLKGYYALVMSIEKKSRILHVEKVLSNSAPKVNAQTCATRSSNSLPT
jgi:hypothetical protein